MENTVKEYKRVQEEWNVMRIKGRNQSPSFYRLKHTFKNKKGASLDVEITLTNDEAQLFNAVNDNALDKIQTGSQRKYKLETTYYMYESSISSEDDSRSKFYALLVNLGVFKKYYRFTNNQNRTINLTNKMALTNNNEDLIFKIDWNHTSEKELSSVLNAEDILTSSEE